MPYSFPPCTVARVLTHSDRLLLACFACLLAFANLSIRSADEPETIPEPSSHYLRPSRTYRIGRSGGLLATKKPGTDKEPPKTKDRLNDWNIKSLTVPKDGVCDLQLGDWDSVSV